MAKGNERISYIDIITLNDWPTQPLTKRLKGHHSKRRTMIETNKLKSLRVIPDDDDEEDFCGFIIDESIIKLNKLKIEMLECAKDIMDNEPIEEIMEDPALGRMIPKRTPIHREIDTQVETDSESRSRNSSGESSLDILDMIPEPQEIANKSNTPKNMTYEIKKKGTSRGNAAIEDSRGFTYDYNGSSKGKTKPAKYTYWKCIKRQNKKINEALKKEAETHPHVRTADIIKKVLEENEDFKEFYENTRHRPLKKTMARTIQRARHHQHMPNNFPLFPPYERM